MKALTLRHPWAFCIAHWGKRIENRSWKPPAALIGQRIAIHGGKVTSSRTELEWIRQIFSDLVKTHGLPEYRVDGDLKLHNILMPGIVATAVIDRAVAYGADDIAEQNPWFDMQPGNIGWVLRDVIVLPKPIPCKGAQGLWDLPPDVLREITQ